MVSWNRLPRSLEGDRVYIIGGGPSVDRSILVKKLAGKIVIACNVAAFCLVPYVFHYAVFGDKLFLRSFRKELKGYVNSGGILINATGRPLEEANDWMVHVKRHNGMNAWGIIVQDPKTNGPTEVSWNRSTGGCAINIAVAMGAKEIVLIGYDMKPSGQKHNWHDVYTPFYEAKDGNRLPKPPLNIYQSLMVRPFVKIAEDLEKLKIKCWNANPDSALTVFPKLTLEELL